MKCVCLDRVHALICRVMFFRRKTKLDLEAMANIVPTSKFDLKMQCLAIARGNVEEAERLYSFLAGDINIPDVSPPAPTLIDQVKDSVGSLFGFVKENQGEIMQAYNFIQSIRAGAPAVADGSAVASSVADLPPLST